ncbi:hypothetical protein GE061_009757 [Apolygus lucorum]|uniref:Uncharacterized protein n=1 Tax=Apolygus lucorum TaxID=248454 RepID=A0A6A4KC97_APOLU|nr:hypothetical protein GE061_009757 [Apolygus lucorum]
MGKYSSDSDSENSYKKSKRKSRRRSTSGSSSSSRNSSSRSKRKKCSKKHKKRSGRSKSREKVRKTRTSRKYSRERDRDRYSRRSRSRSHSYSVTRSPTRHRHRSKDSDASSTRRSRSRDRRKHRSRSRSHSSRRRSRSKDRRVRDDGAELLEKLNKAAIQAMADNSKLREATLNLVNQVAERESAILDIKASGFAPKAFSSTATDRRSEHLPTIVELPEPKPVKINVSMKEDPNSLLHPNLLLEDPEEKLNKWVRKLFLLRQRSLKGEPLAY